MTEKQSLDSLTGAFKELALRVIADNPPSDHRTEVLAHLAAAEDAVRKIGSPALERVLNIGVEATQASPVLKKQPGPTPLKRK